MLMYEAYTQFLWNILNSQQLLRLRKFSKSLMEVNEKFIMNFQAKKNFFCIIKTALK